MDQNSAGLELRQETMFPETASDSDPSLPEPLSELELPSYLNHWYGSRCHCQPHHHPRNFPGNLIPTSVQGKSCRPGKKTHNVACYEWPPPHSYHSGTIGRHQS